MAKQSICVRKRRREEKVLFLRKKRRQNLICCTDSRPKVKVTNQKTFMTARGELCMLGGMFGQLIADIHVHDCGVAYGSTTPLSATQFHFDGYRRRRVSASIHPSKHHTKFLLTARKFPHVMLSFIHSRWPFSGLAKKNGSS